MKLWSGVVNHKRDRSEVECAEALVASVSIIARTWVIESFVSIAKRLLLPSSSQPNRFVTSSGLFLKMPSISSSTSGVNFLYTSTALTVW